MRLEHITAMEAGYTMGMQPDGRELLVVCIKGTFTIPENGSAHAPDGQPATKVPVSLQVGPISKTFNVVGHRVWKNGLLSFKPSKPLPFTRMPISYDTALGGVDSNHKNPKKHAAWMQNPVGVGFHTILKSAFIKSTPLPNTEERGKPVSKPNGKYRPMSFGPMGRGWQPRSALAGTYDQNWMDNLFPFLPADFNDAYFQAAPEDQQMPYPEEGETVGLLNLTPEGRTIFRLPAKSIMVTFFLKNSEEKYI